MTDLERCKQDLKRWDINFDEGYFYDINNCIDSIWLSIGGLEDACMEFSLDGKYEGWC